MSVATEFAPAVTIPERARTHVLAGPPDRLATVIELHPPRELPSVAPIRLTRRGVVVLAIAVAVLGLGLVWLARLSAPQSAASPPAPYAVTVQPGDTLWSIASRVAPQSDPRAEVAALQRRNHLTGVDLTPGQILRVP
jgi:Tfp pilus assembly protein FimV